MKIKRFEDLEVFVRTAEAGSFSVAGRWLGLSPSVASAAIKRLEDTLGARLFERSTRRLRLSEAGERYLPYAREAMASLAQGEALLASAEGNFSGPLRLALPSDLVRSCLLGWLDAYLAQQPDVRLELQVSDRVADLYRHAIDLAIRYGVPEDSSHVALPLAPDNRRVLVASPGYLERHGTPQTLDELAQHNCLRFMLGESIHSRWRFDNAGSANGMDGEQAIHVQGDRIADDADIVRRWAVAGCGIAYKSQLDVAGDLRAGRLVRVLPQLRGESAPLMLLVISKGRVTPSVRRLASYLEGQCRALVEGL